MVLTINHDRFLKAMETQAQFGKTAEGGVSRPALFPENIKVREWFKQLVEADGFAFNMDGVGNLSATYHCDDPSAKTLLMGSHWDSVPNGGRFDGPLGVMCAYESMRTIRDSNISLPFHLETIAYTDEEGTLVGLMGSSAVAGKLSAEKLQNPRGGRARLEEGMARIGITDESILGAKRDPETLLGYLEVHIEQGTRLEEAGIDIGVVSSIVGIRSMWMKFQGEAAHAGTMPMAKRKDAFWGASEFAQLAKAKIMQLYTPGVVNFGTVDVQPGAFNIVPETVSVAVEFRHGTEDDLDVMEADLKDLAQQVAEMNQLQVEVVPVGQMKSAQMDDDVQQKFEQASEDLGLSSTRLLSFAGHDPQSLADLIPCGMIFVPSVDGISHNPKEFSTDDDCVNGANVLLNTVLSFAE